MAEIKQKITGYTIQTFGAAILSWAFIKSLYALNLAGGLCWTTDCEMVSMTAICVFYFIMLFVNTYQIILTVNNKYPMQLLILIFTLVIQMYSSVMGHDFMAATIFYGFAGILNYQIVVRKIKLKAWVALLGAFIMLLIVGVNFLTLTDILIGYSGAGFNPDREGVIKFVLGGITICLIIQILIHTIFKIKKTKMPECGA